MTSFTVILSRGRWPREESFVFSNIEATTRDGAVLKVQMQIQAAEKHAGSQMYRGCKVTRIWEEQ